MKILIIGGNGMRTDDGSEYWKLKERLEAHGHEVRLAECLETGRPLFKVTIADMMWADAIVCYSYGCASTKDIWHTLAKTWDPEKRYKLWIIVAGVPDFWMKQIYGSLWHKPGFVDQAICYQVNAVPASCPLQGPPQYLFANAPDFIAKIDCTLHCDALVNTLDPVSKHTHLQNHPDVLASIVGVLSP